MALLFIFLISSEATTQQIHECIGITMLAAVLFHQYLNFWWYKTLLRVKKNILSTVKNIITFLTIIAFVFSMISGLLMSEYICPFLRGTVKLSLARKLHLCATHWLLILAALHIGLHLLNWINRNISSKLKPICFGITWLISIYGFYLFLENQTLDYLLMKSQFAFLDYKLPLWRTLLENITMIISFIFLAVLLNYFLKNTEEGKK